MKLVFAGTPEFAVPALEALHAAGHQIAAAYTQPPRPAGRGRQLRESAVAQRARTLGLRVECPAKLDADAQALLRALAPEVMVVVAYGLLLPQAVLDIPRHGCLNIHASLLPRWRGAAPIARAVLAGDRETGICIMRMEAGLDTGPVLLRQALAIGEQTAGELHDALAPLGARLIVEALAHLPELRAEPQPGAGATYAKKLGKDEAKLDWHLAAAELARRVRGYNPQPGAWTELGSERVRILRAAADVQPAAAPPGTIVAAGAGGIHVATGAGTLVVTELQFAGGRAMKAQEAAAGRTLGGQRFT